MEQLFPYALLDSEFDLAADFLKGRSEEAIQILERDQYGGESALSKKQRLYKYIGKHSPVFVMPHYPFYFVIDCGQSALGGEGLCDFVYQNNCAKEPLRHAHELIHDLWENHLLYCNDYRCPITARDNRLTLTSIECIPQILFFIKNK